MVQNVVHEEVDNEPDGKNIKSVAVAISILS